MLITSGLLLIFIALLTAVYLWNKYNFNYWKRHNVPFIPPVPFFGNFKPTLTFKKNFAETLCDLYNEPTLKKEPIVGIYLLNEPALLLRDTEVIKNVLIKHFQYFPNRYEACDPHHDVLGYLNLFFVKNPDWRVLRTKMSTVFTSSKMKQMYPLMLDISFELERHVEAMSRNTRGKGVVTEVKELIALYTTDVIASVAFGVRANSLENPNGDFRRHGRTFMHFNMYRAMEAFIIFFKPSWVSIIKPKAFSKEFSQFLRVSIQHVIEERERSGVKLNDLIDVLIAFKKETPTDSTLEVTQDYLVAQAGAFLTAGFETSSGAITFALYELAKRQDLQQILRAEIHEELAGANGSLAYETIHKMKYLDMVVAETLRMYPILAFLDRECILTSPGDSYSLKPLNDFALPHKMPVYIPILAIQRDPQHWPDPNTFNPDRFDAEHIKLHNPMTNIPFGAGPRNCIGLRMGLLLTKLGIVHILKNHYVDVCQQTPMEMKFDSKAFVLTSSGGVFLNIIYDGKAKMEQ